jgi:hypothetical protein
MYRGRQHGNGRCIGRDGTVFEGVWENGNIVHEADIQDTLKEANEAFLVRVDMEEQQRVEDTRRADEAMEKLLREEEEENMAKSKSKKKKKRKKSQKDVLVAVEDEIITTSIEHTETRDPPTAVPAEDVATQSIEVTEPPDEFVCPITQELMVDPVVIADGHTYERSAIETWMQRKAASPMTGASLDCNMIFPNHTLRRQILEWREG